MAAEEVVAAPASQAHSGEVSFRRKISEPAAAALWRMVLSVVICRDCQGAY